VHGLDYKTPEMRPPKLWRRRYAKFVPVFGICYCILFVGMFVSVLTGIGSHPQNPGPLGACLGILTFPMLWVFSGPTPSGVIMLGNAVFWGFCPVVIWHLASIIRWRMSRHTG
jgi:hypothetical protein